MKAIAGLITAAVVLVSADGPAVEAAAAAKKKCAEGKVPVKINGTRRCRPARRALSGITVRWTWDLKGSR